MGRAAGLKDLGVLCHEGGNLGPTAMDNVMSRSYLNDRSSPLWSTMHQSNRRKARFSNATSGRSFSRRA